MLRWTLARFRPAVKRLSHLSRPVARPVAKPAGAAAVTAGRRPGGPAQDRPERGRAW